MIMVVLNITFGSCTRVQQQCCIAWILLFIVLPNKVRKPIDYTDSLMVLVRYMITEGNMILDKCVSPFLDKAKE